MGLETKVGFFVILVAAVLFVLSTRLEQGEVKEGYTLTVRFKTVDGLEEKAPVRIAGVKVGQVESITLDEGQAVLKLRVSKGVSIPVDSHAELRTEDPRQAAAADFSLRGQLRFRAQRRQLLIRGVERTHHAELNQHAI